MIPLNVERMRRATNKTFEMLLNKFHDKLINNQDYNDLYEKVVTPVMVEGDSILSDDYLNAISQISDQFSSQYIGRVILNSSKYQTNTLSTEKISLEIGVLDDESTLLDKLFFINYINENIDVENRNVIMCEKFIKLGGEGILQGSVRLRKDLYQCDHEFYYNNIFNGMCLSDKKNVYMVAYDKNIDKGRLIPIKDIVFISIEYYDNSFEVFMIPRAIWDTNSDKDPLIKIAKEKYSNKPLVDKFDIVNGQISSFELIETDVDIALNWLNIFSKHSHTTEELSTMLHQHFNTKSKQEKMASMCFAIEAKYTNLCVYLNYRYKEWECTDLLSSMINLIDVFKELTKIKDKGKEIEIAIYVKDKERESNFTKYFIIKSAKSRITSDKSGIKDFCVKGVINQMDVLIQRDGCLYNTLLRLQMKSDEDLYHLSLPRVGYKCMIEHDIDSKKFDPLSISFYGVDDYIYINE